MAIQWQAAVNRFRDTETGRFVSAWEAHFTLRYNPAAERVYDQTGRFVPLAAVRGPESLILPVGKEYKYIINRTIPRENIVRVPEGKGAGAWTFFIGADLSLQSRWTPGPFGQDVDVDRLYKHAIAMTARELDLGGPSEISSETIQQLYILKLDFATYEIQ